MTTNQRKTTRQSNYDCLRVLSTVAVIFIHANWQSFKDVYAEPSLSITWIAMSLINIVTRFSVPAFVMLSGAFNLSNASNVNPAAFYKKSLKKIFLPTALLAAFLVCYKIVFNLLDGVTFYDGIIGILWGGFYNLWYIYMLAGLYLLTPLLIKIRQSVSWKQYKTLSVVMLLWAIGSQATSTEIVAYSIGVVFAFLGYYLVGDVLKVEETIRKTSQGKILLAFISGVCVILTFIWRYLGHNYYISNSYINFFSPTIVIYSLCTFMFLSRTRVNSIWSRFAGITLEIYLVHTLMLELLSPTLSVLNISELPRVLILAICTFIASVFAAVIFRKVWNTLSEKINLDKLLDSILSRLFS